MDKLEVYRSKRKFDRTQEPAGSSERQPARTAERRFVIQKHLASHLHYDLRLELDGVLKSWAVPKGPSIQPGERRLAVQVEDHPLEYGDFEGIIPAGEYGGGTVMLWDHGTWSVATSSSGKQGQVNDDRIDFELHGKKLQGAWALIRTQGRSAKGSAKKRPPNWLLIKRSDSGVKTSKPDDLSVLSRRTMEEITQGTEPKPPQQESLNAGLAQVQGAKPAQFPQQLTPTLATLENEVPVSSDWVHEIKFDGYRLLAQVTDDHQVQLLTRNGQNWSHKFPKLQQLLQDLPCQSAVLDGEVVAFDAAGISSFHSLQQALAEQREDKLVYQVFDLLYLDGYDLTKTPIIQRKLALEALTRSLTQHTDSKLKYTDHMVGQGPEFHQHACELGLEGIISKRADSSYAAKRSRAWLKIKCNDRDDFIICGYTAPKRSRSGFGALLLCAWDQQKLIYTGKVGTGFNQRTLTKLSKQLASLEVAESPLHNPPSMQDVTWVKPKLIAAVEFTQWTREGRLRHPVYQGLRQDAKLEDIQLSQPPSAPTGTKAAAPAGSGSKPSLQPNPTKNARSTASGKLKVAGVVLSNPQRIIYPTQGLTKADLAGYYTELAEWVLPYVQHRPLALVRCPAGVTDQCFFQKHPGKTLNKEVPRIMIDGKQGLYIDKLADLLQIVQVGALELHTWGSTIHHIECPDTLVFDLDPAPDVSLKDMYQLAEQLRDFLLSLGLHSFPRITGGKGLHLVVPIQPEYEWPTIKAFCRGIAKTLAHDNPRKATATMSKSKRKGRIFIDYLRNGRGATAIASFSTRARTGAPVATPLRWDEVKASLRPDQYNVGNIKRRLSSLKADPWADYRSVEQSIPATAIKAMEKTK